MNIVRNIFAIIGFLVVLLFIGAAVQWGKFYTSVEAFDPQAREIYEEMAELLLQSGSAAEATVWKMQVKEGLTPEDVETAMKSAAVERNIKDVGELPLYKQVEAATGKPYRFVKIYMFCSALTAARMIDYDQAYSAYLPCRVTLLEDKTGKLWLYTLNLDLMIHGGKSLPPELKQEAMEVKKTILAIMERGAAGAF